MAWWSTYPPGSCESVVLLQVDLSGHSKWIASAENSLEVARLRAEFARNLDGELSILGFDRCFWAGDGGLFAFPSKVGLDRIVPAGDAIFRSFSAFRDRMALDIRASATLDGQVILDPEPGYWCSERLNSFLKYERFISQPNAFVLTRDLYRLMDPSTLSRFSLKVATTLPSGETLHLRVDSQHPGQPSWTGVPFGTWLRSARLPSVTDNPLAVAEATIMDTPQQAAGYDTPQQAAGYDRIAVELPRQDQQLHIPSYLQADWETERSRILLSGIKHGSRPVAGYIDYRGEKEGDNQLHIVSHLLPFADARAFHGLAARGLVRPEDKKAGNLLPSAISSHILVVATSRDRQERVILLTYRAAQSHSYWPSVWSASIEKQYWPYYTDADGYDRNILDSVRRGVAEELGQDFDATMSCSIHAFIREEANLNWGFLALVELGDTTFDEICEAWKRATQSRYQHDALCGLPWRREVILQCLNSQELPKPLWNSAKKVVRVDKDPEKHTWHPTARARLAMALWLLEQSSRPAKRE